MPFGCSQLHCCLPEACPINISNHSLTTSTSVNFLWSNTLTWHSPEVPLSTCCAVPCIAVLAVCVPQCSCSAPWRSGSVITRWTVGDSWVAPAASGLLGGSNDGSKGGFSSCEHRICCRPPTTPQVFHILGMVVCYAAHNFDPSWRSVNTQRTIRIPSLFLTAS